MRLSTKSTYDNEVYVLNPAADLKMRLSTKSTYDSELYVLNPAADLKMRLSTKIMYDIIMVPNSPFSLSAPACESARVRVQQLLGAIPTGLLRISD